MSRRSLDVPKKISIHRPAVLMTGKFWMRYAVWKILQTHLTVPQYGLSLKLKLKVDRQLSKTGAVICVHKDQNEERVVVKGQNTRNIFHHLEKSDRFFRNRGTESQRVSTIDRQKRQTEISTMMPPTEIKQYGKDHLTQNGHDSVETEMIIDGVLPETSVGKPEYLKVMKNADIKLTVQSRFTLSHQITEMYSLKMTNVLAELK